MAISRIHILVVDDLHDAADSMVDLLSIWGYDAVACYSGATALDYARLHPPTVILLDLAMPKMNGFQFTELLRELPGCRSVSIIAMSGYTSLAFRAMARVVGIRHYLPKPADPEYLKDLLERAIEFAMSPVARRKKAWRPQYSGVLGSIGKVMDVNMTKQEVLAEGRLGAAQ
jgi:CheY-like chemotaxis protein